MDYVVHHNDLDGCCCAAQVKVHLNGHTDVTFTPANYRTELDLGKLTKGDRVWLLDYTPSPDVFRTIVNTVGPENVVWLDHHQTNVDKVAGVACPSIKGHRSDTYPSASMLTFNYLNPGLEPPEYVRYVDLWDTWQHGDDREVLAFVWGTKHWGIDTDAQHEAWPALVAADDAILGQVMRDGITVYTFDANQMAARIDDHAFDVRVPTRDGALLKGLALNCGLVNSFAFKSREDRDYDVWVPFYTDGQKYTVSMYAARDLGVHLGQLCTSMGGGGHRAAAGFTCVQLPEWLHRV